MPDPENKEPKTAATATESAPTTSAAPAFDPSKIGDAIAQGVAKGVAESLRSQHQPSTPPTPQPPAPQIADVDDSEIEAAREAGDRDKVVRLTRQQRLAAQQRYERDVESRFGQGIAAINQLAEQTVTALPHFKRFEKDIREKMSRIPQGTLLTPEHWRTAYNLVIGEHQDEITREATEAAIRQQRDQSNAPTPGGSREVPKEDEEPETLAEALGPGFAARFKEKQRATGSRSEEEEIRLMDRAFRNRIPTSYGADGKKTPTPTVDTVAGYLKERKELDELAEADPSLGLGS